MENPNHIRVERTIQIVDGAFSSIEVDIILYIAGKSSRLVIANASDSKASTIFTST